MQSFQDIFFVSKSKEHKCCETIYSESHVTCIASITKYILKTFVIPRHQASSRTIIPFWHLSLGLNC